MKKITIYKLMALFITAAIFFASCTKETSDVRLDQKLSTSQVTNIKSGSATVTGFVVAAGDGFIERGVCYNTVTGPTTANSKIKFSDTAVYKKATFNVILTGLNYATKYYARAYAISPSGTIYGEEINFTTLPIVPALTTAPTILAITSNSAASGGNITNAGGADVTARGVCYSTKHNPTISDGKTTDGNGTGSFTSSITGLTGSTTYYVRAYATNSAGTGYGNELSFTTLTDKLWIIGDYNNWTYSKTANYVLVPTTSNTAEGYIYFPASGEFLFSSNPDYNDNAHTFGDDGSGKLTNPGNKISVPSAGYYLVNADVIKKTYSLTKTTWGLIGDATAGGWNTDTPLTYDQKSSTWRGVAHLTAANLKFRANGGWDINYGSTAKNSTLDAGGSNIPITVESDYAVVLDLSHPLAYTYTANRWGVIGDATPDLWNSDQNMTWDATNKVFTVTLNLTVGSLKFRANDAWDLNYGGDINALTPGGANISVTTAGNYTVTFDPFALKATVTKN